MLQALVLIALVILLFLQSVRGTVIVVVAIPLSFAIILIVLYATGQTLNAFTLGGLTLAMGRLVDDSVVVLESIHRHQQHGPGAGAGARWPAPTRSRCRSLAVDADDDGRAACRCSCSPASPRSSSRRWPLTVAVGMIASYFVSMCVTPLACRYFLGHDEPGRFGTASGGVHRSPRPRLRGRAARGAALPHRPSSAACVVLVAASVLDGRPAAEHVLPRD